MSINRPPFSPHEQSAIGSVLKTTHESILAEDHDASEPTARAKPSKDRPWGIADEGQLSALLARSTPLSLDILSAEMSALLSPSRPGASAMTPEEREEKAARSEAVRQEVADFNKHLAAQEASEGAQRPQRPRP